MSLRITRSRPPNMAPLAPETGQSHTGARIRRTRPAPSDCGRTRYVIDWEMSLGRKLQLYLMSSFLYYCLNRAVITDHDYDRLCNELYAGWPTLKHQHKYLVDRGSLRAGTGFAIKYPRMVSSAASYLLENHIEL